nr:hypothetical protein CFP56_52492 [Quercus suber]
MPGPRHYYYDVRPDLWKIKVSECITRGHRPNERSGAEPVSTSDTSTAITAANADHETEFGVPRQTELQETKVTGQERTASLRGSPALVVGNLPWHCPSDLTLSPSSLPVAAVTACPAIRRCSFSVSFISPLRRCGAVLSPPPPDTWHLLTRMCSAVRGSKENRRQVPPMTGIGPYHRMTTRRDEADNAGAMRGKTDGDGGAMSTSDERSSAVHSCAHPSLDNSWHGSSGN